MALNYALKHGGVYVSANETVEGVEFLTAEIKVCKGEACENTSTARLQQCVPAKSRSQCCGRLKARYLQVSHLPSVALNRNVKHWEGRKHDVEELALKQNSFSFNMTMLYAIQGREQLQSLVALDDSPYSPEMAPWDFRFPQNEEKSSRTSRLS
jgi:hypothetical protein